MFTGACDPVGQTCSDPAASKCTLVNTGGNRPACVPLTGDVEEGEACVRAPEGFGHDDCAPGLFCTFIDVLPPSAGGTRHCRRLCHQDGDCSEGGRCAILDAEAPANGFCGTPCTPFGADCPDMLECSRLWFGPEGVSGSFLTCRLPAGRAPGEVCDPADEDCAPGNVCASLLFSAGPRCHPLCDDAHPCATGKCLVPPGLAAGACDG
jgi:hypothetical protein